MENSLDFSLDTCVWTRPWSEQNSAEQLCGGEHRKDPPAGVETYMERVISELLPWAEQLFGVAPEASQRWGRSGRDRNAGGRTGRWKPMVFNPGLKNDGVGVGGVFSPWFSSKVTRGPPFRSRARRLARWFGWRGLVDRLWT